MNAIPDPVLLLMSLRKDRQAIWMDMQGIVNSLDAWPLTAREQQAWDSGRRKIEMLDQRMRLITEELVRYGERVGNYVIRKLGPEELLAR